MITKENFELGKDINSKIYDYDEYNVKHTREINGKVYQVTRNFVVIDNGKYKESFKYSQFEPNNVDLNPKNYAQYLEYYKDEIVNDCIENFKNKGKGFVFNFEQLKKVINSGEINSGYSMKQEDGIIYIIKS